MRNLYNKVDNAKNFSYLELIKSDIAIRLGFDNFPKEDYIWINLEKLVVNCLQPIRNHFGPIRVLSGYRCQLLNVAIGSSINSNHIYGQAVDFEPLDNSVKLIDVLNWICDNLDFRELIAEYFNKNGWIHIVYRENCNNKILKLKDRNHNYSIVNIDDLNKLYK